MPCDFKTKDGEYDCQFDVAEQHLYEFQGQQWCEFHLPIEDMNGKKSNKSNWGEEKVDKFNQKIFSIIDSMKALKGEGKVANLTGVVFPGPIKLDNKKIPEIDFNEATFSGDTGFADTIFNGTACFKNTRFNGAVGFEEASFASQANFVNATFNDIASFSKTTFSGGARFYEATFIGHVAFNETTFNYVADFQNAIFSRDAGFEAVTFSHEARFRNASFCGNAWFCSTRFNGKTWFNANTDQSCDSKGATGNHFRYIDFEGSAFKEEVSFINRRFLETSSYKNCSFEKAPNFHNCQLHQDTDFKGTIFNDIESDDADRAYRTLKLAMEQNRARDEQARFYALEQQSIRNQKETPYWVKLSSWLYEKTSNYGQSALRPLVGLFLCFLFSWSIYNALSDIRSATASDTRDFAIEQIVRPFNTWTYKGKETAKTFTKGNLVWVRYTAALQSLISLVFITLFILALRWRYRRG